MADPVTTAISLIVSTPDRPGELLIGIRTPTATSKRHPNVLSTPTMRIPRSMLGGALEEQLDENPPLPKIGEIAELPPSEPVAFGGAQTLASGISYFVESVFARKLGAADLLVNGLLHGQAHVTALAMDLVPDVATEKDELTLMLTVGTKLEAGASLIPEATPSYSRLLWVPFVKLSDAVDSIDALRVDSELDLMVCIHGLCVRSAAQILA